MPSFLNRKAATLAAAVAAVAVVAVIATPGSAQSPGPTTLQIVSTAQKNVGFFPQHRPRQGDRFGFGSKDTGDETGYDRAICTQIGVQALCVISAKLSKGTLAFQGFLPPRPKNSPLAVTGGTGAYEGARGTALVTDRGQGVSDVTITLVP